MWVNVKPNKEPCIALSLDCDLSELDFCEPSQASCCLEMSWIRSRFFFAKWAEVEFTTDKKIWILRSLPYLKSFIPKNISKGSAIFNFTTRSEFELKVMMTFVFFDLVYFFHLNKRVNFGLCEPSFAKKAGSKKYPAWAKSELIWSELNLDAS